MKTRIRVRVTAGSLALAVTVFSLNRARAAVYEGTSSGPVGGGTLQLTDNGTKVSATFTKGSGSLGNNLVIFLDTGVGGFADTTQFSDTAGGLQRSISGYNGTSRASAYFASGFAAQYAIALGIDQGGALYRLASGGDGSLTWVNSVNFSPNNDANSPQFTFSFLWSDLGLDTGSQKGFRFETSSVYQTGARYLESFENLSGSSGFNTVTYTDYDIYGTPVPEPLNAALGLFGGLAATVGLASRARRSWAKGRCR